MNILLPTVGDFRAGEHYAENLREAAIGGDKGCVTTGVPTLLLSDAGMQTLRVSSRLLTVGADGRSLAIDGIASGTLSAPFLSALPDGENMIIFTEAGAEWLSDGALQGAAPDMPDVALSIGAASHRLNVQVVPPSKLSGSYTRLSESLQEVDRRAFVAPIAEALESVRSMAFARGLLTQPAWVSWRMIDVDGSIVGRGAPQKVGGVQGNSPLTFSATKNDSTFTLDGSPTLTVDAFSLNIDIARSASAFWRRRVRTLEIILWPDCCEIVGTTGHFSPTDTNKAALIVTPQIEETTRIGNGIIAAQIELPLEGVSATLALGNLGVAASSGEVMSTLKVSELHRAGTVNAYALADAPGVISVAPANDPLHPAVSARICRGEIFRICSPAGSSGGWNYGRHHLLAFASDGIFAVSVDSSLTRIAAAPVSVEGVMRRDAVCVTPEAIFVAPGTGNLLKIKGSRVEIIPAPVIAKAVGYSARFCELWLVDGEGGAVTLSADMRVAARTLFKIKRFDSGDMAVDSNGGLRSLDSEDSPMVPIAWRRRVRDSRRSGRNIT